MKAITSIVALAMAFASVSAHELRGGSVVSLNGTLLLHRPLSLHLSQTEQCLTWILSLILSLAPILGGGG
jgi:hypothetical protein